MSELPKTDLIQDIINPSSKQGESQSSPVVQLSSDRSGLKLSFFTNRAYAIDVVDLNAVSSNMDLESGVQFYSGNFVGPTSSRKKIHGGSGELGKGDGYKAGGECLKLQFKFYLSIPFLPQRPHFSNFTK